MRKSKFYSSLGRRIAFVFLLLVVLPLLFYIGFLWSRDWKLKLNTVFSEMKLLGDFSRIYLEKWQEEAQIQLRTKSAEEWEKNPSTIYVFNKELECTYSTMRSLIGRRDVFPEVVQEAFHREKTLFLGKNPITGKTELLVFALQKKGKELTALGVDVDNWFSIFASLRKIGYPILLSFMTPNQSLKDQNTVVWTVSDLDKWQKKAGIWEWIRWREKNFAVIFPVPKAQFVLVTSITTTQMNRYEGGAFFTHILVLLSGLFLIGGAGAILLITRLSKPLQKLYEVMEGARYGQYSKKYVTDPFGFEINLLGETFNQMLEDLLRNKDNAAKEKLSREILSKELEIGRTLQKELFPKELPEFPSISIGIGFEPAKEVAGDFYDFFACGPNRLMIAIADASDKGISACLYSLTVRSMLRSYAMAGESLESIMEKVNRLFSKDTGLSGNFVTAWVGIFEIDTHTLHYSSAGHLPAILMQQKGSQQEELTTQGTALGVIEDAMFTVSKRHLKSGDLLCLYSDGVIEAHNQKGDLFGKSRLLGFLQDHSFSDTQELANALVTQVQQFTGNVMQHDDLTIVCLKIH